MYIWTILFQGKESLFIAPSFSEQGTGPLITKGKRKKERQLYNDCRLDSLDSERNRKKMKYISESKCFNLRTSDTDFEIMRLIL